MHHSLVRGHATVRHGAYLPHWTLDGATYAVCFRLADSLPRSTAEAWRHECEALRAEAGTVLTPAQEYRLRELFSERVESCLDSCRGACWLRRSEIAEIVAETLKYFDGERHQLLAWCIMPNHVHAVVRPLDRHTLVDILKSWKGFSGREANQLLGLHGDFWQAEYYDHIIRDAAELAHAITYVIENPRKAGLQQWPWVWAKTGWQREGFRVEAAGPSSPRLGRAVPPGCG